MKLGNTRRSKAAILGTLIALGCAFSLAATPAEAQSQAEKYAAQLRQIDNLKGYNVQLTGLISAQDTEMQQLQRELGRVGTIDREVVPLMFRMIDALEIFMGLDMPFLLEERKGNLAELKTNMGRSDLTAADKFRSIMEAYEDELEYGRTIGAYSGILTQGETPRTVNFLRIGRVALVYQTLDGDEMAVWDTDEKNWKELGSNWRVNIAQAVRIAKEQAAPDLLLVPIKGPSPTQVSEAQQ